jgi:hypothetical protein
MYSFGEICRLLWIRWFSGKDKTTGTGRTHFMSKKRSGIAGFDKEDEERKKLQPLLKLSLAEHSITSI